MEKLFKEIFKKIKFRKWNKPYLYHWENINIDLIINKRIERCANLSIFFGFYVLFSFVFKL